MQHVVVSIVECCGLCPAQNNLLSAGWSIHGNAAAFCMMLLWLVLCAFELKKMHNCNHFLMHFPLCIEAYAANAVP